MAGIKVTRCANNGSDHRLDGVSFMAALHARSFGVGFSNVDAASKTLLAGRRRPPAQVLYGQQR